MQNIKAKRFNKFILLNLTLLVMPLGDLFFFIPSRITSGGMYGLAIILMHFFGLENSGGLFVSTVALLLTSPLLVYSYFYFSEEYFKTTAYATIVYPLFMWFIDSASSYMGIEFVEKNLLFSTLAGTIIQGVGIGIVMGLGSSTGGTDIAAKIINQYFPFISIGAGVIFSNLVIVIITTFMFGLDRAIATVASIVLTGWLIDLTLKFLFNKGQGEL